MKLTMPESPARSAQYNASWLICRAPCCLSGVELQPAGKLADLAGSGHEIALDCGLIAAGAKSPRQ
jgi:hypothetical protein